MHTGSTTTSTPKVSGGFKRSHQSTSLLLCQSERSREIGSREINTPRSFASAACTANKRESRASTVKGTRDQVQDTLRKWCTGKAQSADIEPARLPQRCHRIGLNGLADGQPLAARLIPRRALTCVERRAVGRLNKSPPESRTAACDNRDNARHRATTVASIDVASAAFPSSLSNHT